MGKVLGEKARHHWPELPQARPGQSGRTTAPSPPPSAPAFPDGMRARFRSKEAPCLFMLYAFLPRASSVFTEFGFRRARPRKRASRLRAPLRVPDTRTQQPPRKPSRWRSRSRSHY